MAVKKLTTPPTPKPAPTVVDTGIGKTCLPDSECKPPDYFTQWAITNRPGIVSLRLMAPRLKDVVADILHVHVKGTTPEEAAKDLEAVFESLYTRRKEIASRYKKFLEG